MNVQALSWCRPVARRLAGSRLFSAAKETWKANQLDWNLRLSKRQKIHVGIYLILDDFAAGNFPPRFFDQRAVHDAEMAYRGSSPGVDADTDSMSQLRKPFWTGHVGAHLRDHARIAETLESLGVLPPARLLEAGCGTGWMSEFLALQGYSVVGTDISDVSIADAGKRIDSLRYKGIDASLDFRVGRMETLDTDIEESESFAAIIVYEALHHAHDWRSFVAAAFRMLRPEGWLLICNEPNLIHTAVAYRVGKFSNTHEVGMSRAAMRNVMSAAGFGRVSILANGLHWYIKPHWIAAQKRVT